MIRRRVIASIGPQRHWPVFGSCRFATSKPAPYFDALDGLWNGSGGAVAATVVPSSSASSSSFLGSAVTAIGAATGWEPSLCLVCIGFGIRLVTLVFSLYGERAAERMQAVVPLLKPRLDLFQNLRESGRETEIHIAATELKAAARSVYRQHGTSNLKAAAGLLGSPLVLYGFVSVSKLCSVASTADTIGSCSFWWCPALAWPDPLHVLPVASVALTLLNFEAALRLRNSLSSTWMTNLLWGARITALLSLSAVSQVSTGVLLYWIGLSLAGLLQPALLRSSSFRRRFKFPEVSSLKSVPMDPLQARLALKIPMLRELYDPQLQEEITPDRTAKSYARSEQLTPFWRKK
jgi:membrane protein insertase Oxa1/YidC/SpoIIIJ